MTLNLTFLIQLCNIVFSIWFLDRVFWKFLLSSIKRREDSITNYQQKCVEEEGLALQLREDQQRLIARVSKQANFSGLKNSVLEENKFVFSSEHSNLTSYEKLVSSSDLSLLDKDGFKKLFTKMVRQLEGK